MVLLLVASPLLGAASWHPTDEALAETVEVDTVALDGVTSPDGLVDRVRRAARVHREPPVLVVHSNAGYYAPHLAALTEAWGVVYVDAALPTPTGGRTPLAPSTFRDLVRSLDLDGDGLLPPWTSWWPDPDGLVGGLFPSAHARDRVEASQPRLPPTYFSETVPVPDDWTERRSAYLAFGDTYADELARARSFGWPTSMLDGGHLHQVHDGPGVARAVLDLIDSITVDERT